MHLWNVKVSGNLENNHFPALPYLKAEDGWAPIEYYLRIITKENKNVKIMFEHRSDLISDEEITEGKILSVIFLAGFIEKIRKDAALPKWKGSYNYPFTKAADLTWRIATSGQLLLELNIY